MGRGPGAAAPGGAGMLIALIGVVGLVLAGLIVSVFVNWERTGKEHLVPLFLLGMLVIEATLYADPTCTAAGRPGSAWGAKFCSS